MGKTSLKCEVNGFLPGIWYKIIRVLVGEGLVQIQDHNKKVAVVHITDLDALADDF